MAKEYKSMAEMYRARVFAGGEYGTRNKPLLVSIQMVQMNVLALFHQQMFYFVH